MGLVVLFKQECVCELYVSYSNCAENTFIVEEFIHYYACKCSDGWKGSVCTNGTYITLSKSYSMNCVWFYLQMKERELDYKKSMEQLLKDKDDANRQLKMMQEGERISNIYHTRYIYVGITPCQGIKKILPPFWRNIGSSFYSTGWHYTLKMTVICNHCENWFQTDMSLLYYSETCFNSYVSEMHHRNVML